jgi:hypothetical protein
MSTVKVAVPVLQGRRKFFFDKGRPWTVLEQLLLHELDRAPASIPSLASRAHIPERVIVEAIIRLMRAGWVEMMQMPAAVHFQITPEGRVVKEYDQLPTAPRRLSRRITFVIDQITGALFRSRDLPFTHQHVVEERVHRGEAVVWIERPERRLNENLRPLVDALFQSDERFVSIDPYGDRLADRWALVSVRDGQPEGLVPRTPARLVKEIVKAAEKFAGAGTLTHTAIQTTYFKETQKTTTLRNIAFTANDLITGGEAHEAALRNAIRRARHRLVLHSTFISRQRFSALLPELRNAVGAGVKVDVLWGQDENTADRRSTGKVVSQLRSELQAEGLDGLVVHPFSTGSHSKIILADDGNPDRMVAVVGSCNWLYSGFESFEVSVRLRDAHIVADVIDQLAEMSRGANRHWTNLTSELMALAENLKNQSPSAGPKAAASIVLGASHADLVREARDNAMKQITIVSHRFAGAAQSLILAPAFAASKKSKQLSVRLFYGDESGAITGTEVAEFARAAAKAGVQIRPVYRPRLHAKFLASDDDLAVITSQNWLSADAADDNPQQEIGVCIRSPGVARILVERFEAVTA